MDDFVNTSNEKNIVGQDKISFLPTEKRYIMVADEETGEIKGCFPIKSNKLGKGWLALYQNPSLWLAEQNMTGEQYRVLFVLFSKLDFDNYICVSRKEIAQTLQIQPVHVSRAMKRLKELEIVVEGPIVGKFKTYRLNPYIAHKGANRDKTIIDFESLQQQNTLDDEQ